MAAADDIREMEVGDHVVAFDGRVLEVFNDADGSIRMHVARMKVKLKPGFKNRLYVELRAERRGSPRAVFEVQPDDRPAFEELMAEVEEARATAMAARGELPD